MRLGTCPSPEDLAAFAIGNLSLRTLDRIAGHVDQCPQCERVLADCDAAADGLIGDVRRAASESSDATDELVAMARDAVQGSSTSFSLDPGKRIARQLAEGSCRIGRFELLEEVGSGSFGYVFRALDTQLERIVAIKILRAGGLASDDEIRRFQREARSVAQLKHPSVVALYDTGQTEDELFYLVTEFVEGETLEERLSREPVDAATAVGWTRQLAEAVDYAHGRGVIHRDIKPSNILIDSNQQPHVMDFGLAKREAADASMTSDGLVMGTPAYMSPEQARGESQDVDGRSDVYSLGVVLYEMITGERPFRGNRRMLLLQVLQDEPRAPRQLDESVPHDLETVCLKALQKAPGRRYQTAGELAEDLRRFLRGEPILARPITYRERFWRWCRANPVAASLFVAVLAGSLFGLWRVAGLTDNLVKQSALASARIEVRMLEEINQFYSDLLANLNRNQVKVTHEYSHVRGAMPLPATFTIDAGERISRTELGLQVRLYSDKPWRDSGGPKDEFERKALRVLRERVESEGPSANNQASYYEFSPPGALPELRFAQAQVMKESCLDCHKTHPQSPFRDWQEGDVVGVMSIRRPLDSDIALTRTVLQDAVLVLAGMVLIVGGAAAGATKWAKRR